MNEPTARDGQRARRFAIRAGVLYDGTGGPARRDPLVVIDGDRIASIEDGARADTVGCPVVPVPGTAILPGYVDAHVHLAFPWLHEPPSEAIGRRAAENAGRALAGGVTTARDLGGPGDTTIRLRDAIRSGRVAGPRLLVAGAPITTPDGHCHWFGRHARTAAEVRRAVRSTANAGVDWIKLLVTGGMSTPGSDPYAPQFPVEAVRAAVAEAHRLGKPVAAHVLGAEGVRIALAARVDTLEHGWTITGRPQRFDPAVVPELAAAGLIGSVTAHHELRGLVPWDGARGDRDELRRRLAPHREMAEAGVPMVVHSDAGPGPTRYEAFGDSIAAYQVGMEASVPVAVHAATLAPARALGLAHLVGSVAPGRIADLVLLRGDPARQLPAWQSVDAVYQAGRLVASAGALVEEPLPDGTEPH
jgi:imidazolonepropionase-like amidohydrolase